MKGFKLFTPEENLVAFKEGKNYDSFYYTAEKNAEFSKKLDYIKAIPDFKDFVDTSYLKNFTKTNKVEGVIAMGKFKRNKTVRSLLFYS